ncbi:MAG TPA: hypothetical protein VMW87_01805 [Spirochaetia bacterium]|nr:hypothetical protein [Spirochaetia bacterium]
MTCDEAMSRFDDLDRGEELSGDLAEHLRSCSNCRRVIQRVSLAMDALPVATAAALSAVAAETDAGRVRFADAVMRRVHEEPEMAPAASQSERVPLMRWIIVGVIILVAMPLSSFSDSLVWLSRILGTSLIFPLHVVLGVGITLYALMFIASHLKEIADWLHVKPSDRWRKLD